MLQPFSARSGPCDIGRGSLDRDVFSTGSLFSDHDSIAAVATIVPVVVGVDRVVLYDV